VTVPVTVFCCAAEMTASNSNGSMKINRLIMAINFKT
jgi:hypothetical protein